MPTLSLSPLCFRANNATDRERTPRRENARARCSLVGERERAREKARELEREEGNFSEIERKGEKRERERESRRRREEREKFFSLLSPLAETPASFHESSLSLVLPLSNDMHDPSAGSIPPLPLPPRVQQQQQQQHGWGVGSGDEVNLDVDDLGDAPATTMHAPGRYSSHEQAAHPSFLHQQQAAGENADLASREA